MNDLDLIRKLAVRLYEKKAEDITALNVGHLTVLCEQMLIASGRSAAQVSSLCDTVDEFMNENRVPLRRSEGLREARWAVLDYGFLLVHIFHRDDRAFYDLERLWTDGENRIDLPFDQTVPD
ncbi:MAG: ribosome silencing factor [Clostridia bacterium]|nr:ribosome silencing factor [Clostridia bacterium]